MNDVRFATIHDFYTARGGERSGESDFGAWWTDGREPRPRGPRYRVSVVHYTGDVYAVNHWTGEVELLGSVGPTDCPDGMDHDADCPYALVEASLKGWAEERRDLDWARERLA